MFWYGYGLWDTLFWLWMKRKNPKTKVTLYYGKSIILSQRPAVFVVGNAKLNSVQPDCDAEVSRYFLTDIYRTLREFLLIILSGIFAKDKG